MAPGLKELKRVLIVDDSPLTCKVLARVVNEDPELVVAGVAHDGQEAVKLVPKLKPDLITMDIHMPVMDGFEATKQIMAFCPTPILIIASTIFRGGLDLTFEALAYGALDAFDKTVFENSGDPQRGAVELVTRIKQLSRVKVITHPLGRLQRRATAKQVKVPAARIEAEQIVAIAASTGGPQALCIFLQALPRGFPCGIVIVQHIASGFAEGLAKWLDQESSIQVKLAVDAERIKPGIAYVAPTGVQMRLAQGGLIRLADEAPYDGHKPSASVLFASVAQVYGQRAVGVILSGMGADGAAGLKQLKETGGCVIAQDEATSVVFGMAGAAVDLGVVDAVLPIGRISERVVQMLQRSPERVLGCSRQS